MEKICFKCQERKELAAFYKHAKMADGHLNKCKECTKTDTRANIAANSDYYKQYDRSRANLPHRVSARKSYAEKIRNDPQALAHSNAVKKEYMLRNTIKRAAHIITGNAIRDGRLIKQPCEVCDAKKVDAHHDNYEEPLNVRWLCRKHHVEHHVRERELQRRA